jgi:hypothetical protein
VLGCLTRRWHTGLADIGAHRSLGIAESMNEAARHGELEEVLAQVDDLDRAVADACVEFALVAHRDA